LTKQEIEQGAMLREDEDAYMISIVESRDAVRSDNLIAAHDENQNTALRQG
jgi:hypothetical protein